MTKKMVLVLCSALLTCGTAFSATTSSQPSAPTTAEIVSREVSFLTNVLSLTPDQQTAITTILTTEVTTTTTLRSSLETARTALQTAITSNDTSAIATDASNMGSLEAQQVQAEATADAAIYALLTSDQQTKFAALLARGLGLFGGGPGGPGSGGFHGPGR